MKQLRVLIVDDDSTIRLDLREMVEEAGHAVVGEASTGDEALVKSRKLDPGLVLLDIKMPGMSGLEALKRMNEEKHRPVVILTAFSDRGFVDEAVELGAAAYIVKPFDPAGLVPAIRLALAHFEELELLRKENLSLKEAIEANRLITRAKRALMRQDGMSEGEAFRMIQKLSMEKRKKMKDVAEAVLLLYGEG